VDTLAFVGRIFFLFSSILYALPYVGFCTGFVVLVVVVVATMMKYRTTLISRPVEVGFQRRLDRTLPLTLPLTRKQSISQIRPFSIELWQFKKNENLHLLHLCFYCNFCYSCLVTIRETPVEPEGAN
jgi:hypothetical protein